MNKPLPKLLPCPFCGSHAVTVIKVRSNGWDCYSPTCEDCGTHSQQNIKYEDAAIERWNKARPLFLKAETPDPQTPPHYTGPVTPWDLEKRMQSSGSAFVDSRRTDAIEYCFRLKGDLIGDLRKARHCLDEAIKVLAVQPPPDL